MLGIIGWAIFGVIVGAIAKALDARPRSGRPARATMLLGIAGALVAGFIGRALGMVRTGRGRRLLIMATLGAILLQFVYGR